MESLINDIIDDLSAGHINADKAKDRLSRLFAAWHNPWAGAIYPAAWPEKPYEITFGDIPGNVRRDRSGEAIGFTIT